MEDTHSTTSMYTDYTTIPFIFLFLAAVVGIVATRGQLLKELFLVIRGITLRDVWNCTVAFSVEIMIPIAFFLVITAVFASLWLIVYIIEVYGIVMTLAVSTAIVAVLTYLFVDRV
jgi:hypothetical protein